MIEAQSKLRALTSRIPTSLIPTSLISTSRLLPSGMVPKAAHPHGLGSVPTVLPSLLPTAARLESFCYGIASFLLIVVVPSAFWCGVVYGLAKLLAYDIGLVPLAVLGGVLVTFLTIIRASLTINR
jgi:hypothetical protein